MPWRLRPGALARLRRARKLSRTELADLTGIAYWTVVRHETQKATSPRFVQPDTVARYAKSFRCEREEIAEWIDHEDAKAERELEDAETSPLMPAPSTLERRARMEREKGVHESIEHCGQTFTVVGPTILQRCLTAAALLQDERFAVVGLVGDQGHLPEPAAQRLGAAPAVGARFKVERKLAKGVPFYATVFTRTKEHTAYLWEKNEARKRASMIVRVAVHPPDPSTNWKGFFIFEKPSRPRDAAFVVEEVGIADRARR